MRATEIGGEGLGDAAPTLVIARKDTLGTKVVDVDVADPAVEGGTGGVRLPTLLKRTAGIPDGAAAEIVVVDGAQRGEVVASGGAHAAGGASTRTTTLQQMTTLKILT